MEIAWDSRFKIEATTFAVHRMPDSGKEHSFGVARAKIDLLSMN